MAQNHRAAHLFPCWRIVEPTRWDWGLSDYIIESLTVDNSESVTLPAR